MINMLAIITINELLRVGKLGESERMRRRTSFEGTYTLLLNQMPKSFKYGTS